MAGLFFQQKTRDCFGNRGFLEICLKKLEVSSHDAGGAVPHGRQSSESLRALANFNRGSHHSNAPIEPHQGRNVNFNRRGLLFRL
jgi:hypothetical protein